MIPTAQSQVVETVLRIAAQLLLAAMFLPMGLAWAAAGAMLGTVIGEVAGLLIMFYHAYKDRRLVYGQGGSPGQIRPQSESLEERERIPVLRRLLRLSIPVTGSRLVGSLSYLLESILIARSLAVAGIATGAATAQYGALQAMVLPLLLLPTALTYSLSVSLIPSLSAAAARNDAASIHKRLHQSLRLALVSGAPFVVIMGLLAEPLCRILYGHAEIAPLLAMLAPAGIFIYLQGPLQATLQALDKPGTALLNTTIGACVKLYLIGELASRPDLGIYGAVIAIIVNIVLVTVLHGISVMRCAGYRMKLRDFFKVGSAMIIMGAACSWLMSHGPLPADWLNLIVSCGAGATLYLALMAAMGIIDRHDLVSYPLYSAAGSAE